jgi:PPK2 family polyphosphate:nucleotide phosphotransferase
MTDEKIELKRIVKSARRLSRPYRIEGGRGFRLKDIDPGDTGTLEAEGKPQALASLASGRDALAELQDMLYAQNRWAVLLVFQAMDAAGKDGTIKHVMSGVNPQGCQVFSFKAPSAEELDHDFLWRCMKSLPERGRIGIFNRSYYEEVLVVKVHPEYLAAQNLPPQVTGKSLWKHRYQDIRAFERYLSRNGVLVRKFFLHVSRAEQKRRFLERIDEAEKHWKFSAGDVRESARWDDYMAAYEEAIRETATPESPWYVVPADNKWFTRTVVAAAVVDALASLDLHYPTLDKRRLAELAESKKALLAEKR